MPVREDEDPNDSKPSFLDPKDIAELEEKARERETRQEAERMSARSKPSKSALPGGQQKTSPAQREHLAHMSKYWSQEFQGQSSSRLNAEDAAGNDATEKEKSMAIPQATVTPRTSVSYPSKTDNNKGKAKLGRDHRTRNSKKALTAAADTNGTVVERKPVKMSIEDEKKSTMSSSEKSMAPTSSESYPAQSDNYKAGTRLAKVRKGVSSASKASGETSNRTLLVEPTTLERVCDRPGAFSYAGPGASDDGNDDEFDEFPEDEVMPGEQAPENPGMMAETDVEATMVSDAEKIYVAEDTKHDTYRRNLLIIMSIGALVIAGAVTAMVILLPEDEDDENLGPCDVPIEMQPVARRCNCTGSTMGFYDKLSIVGKEAYAKQKNFLLENEFYGPKITDDTDSCDVDNLNLLIAANISEMSERGVAFWNLSAPVFQLSVHTLIDMYLTMGGLWWKETDDWLTDEICSWYGLLCSFQEIVEEFEMPENELSGTLQTYLGLLGTVRRLVIFDNDDVGGTIPTEIGQLTELRELTLKELALTGTIPDEFGDFQKIDGIDLSENMLSGTLPDSLFDLEHLRFLRLSANNLRGTISSNIFNATRLIQLDLAENEFSGTLPSEIAQLTHLEILSLNDNMFTGPIPAFLGEMQHLSLVFLHGSGLDQDSIPETFCTSSRHRSIIVDCPDDKLPSCACCSQTDHSVQVHIVCESDLAEEGEGG